MLIDSSLRHAGGGPHGEQCGTYLFSYVVRLERDAGAEEPRSVRAWTTGKKR